MARLALGLLCDYANVRDRLLTIVSGGVNQITPTRYPAPASVWLAIGFEFEAADYGVDHHLRVLILDPDSTRLAELGGKFAVAIEPQNQPPETLRTLVPFALDLRGATLPGPGVYEVRVTLDRKRPMRLLLWARPERAEPR